MFVGETSNELMMCLAVGTHDTNNTSLRNPIQIYKHALYTEFLFHNFVISTATIVHLNAL